MNIARGQNGPLQPIVLGQRDLTPRETDVAFWLSQGKTNPEIGLILGIASRTVEKHVEQVLRKLGVENRTAAALALNQVNGQLGDLR